MNTPVKQEDLVDFEQDHNTSAKDEDAEAEVIKFEEKEKENIKRLQHSLLNLSPLLKPT